jgi:hypothetical protein
MRLPQVLALILLMSMASFAQSNPTSFTNQTAGFQTGDFVSTVDTEDGQPVNQSACPGGSGCFIAFQFSQNEIGIQLPDFPDVVLTCNIAITVVNPPGFCFTTGCQSVTYTATSDSEDTCMEVNGRVWNVTTTQQRHWIQSGTKISGPVWDGGNGTISLVGKKGHKKH